MSTFGDLRDLLPSQSRSFVFAPYFPFTCTSNPWCQLTHSMSCPMTNPMHWGEATTLGKKVRTMIEDIIGWKTVKRDTGSKKQNGRKTKKEEEWSTKKERNKRGRWRGKRRSREWKIKMIYCIDHKIIQKMTTPTANLKKQLQKGVMSCDVLHTDQCQRTNHLNHVNGEKR